MYIVDMFILFLYWFNPGNHLSMTENCEQGQIA